MLQRQGAVDGGAPNDQICEQFKGARYFASLFSAYY